MRPPPVSEEHNRALLKIVLNKVPVQSDLQTADYYPDRDRDDSIHRFIIKAIDYLGLSNEEDRKLSVCYVL